MPYEVLALPVASSYTMASSVSSKGNFVAGTGVDSDAPDLGVIWHIDPVGAPSISFSIGTAELHDVNSFGEAVGARGNDPTRQIPMYVDRNSTAHDLILPRENGWTALSVNERGLVGGAGHREDGQPATMSFLYDARANKVTRWIEPLPGKQWSVANAVNAHGDAAGYSGRYGTDNFDSNAFFVEDGRPVKDLGPGRAASLNDDGIVCGGLLRPGVSGEFDFVPAVWDAKQARPAAQELPLPPEFYSGFGLGINNKGFVVGSGWVRSGHESAFVVRTSPPYDGADLNRQISDPDWQLTYACDINDSGQITGWGRYQGRTASFLLTPLFRDPPVGDPPDKKHIDLLGSFDRVVGNVLVGGGTGWIVRPGQPPIPVPRPEGGWGEIPADTRAALMGLVLDELAMHLQDADTRERVRTELLDGVQARLDQLRRSLAEGPVAAADTAAVKAKMDGFLARRFGTLSSTTARPGGRGARP